MNAQRKIKAKTVFVLRVKMKVVKSQNPHIVKYRAIAALYPTEAAPSAASPVALYEAAMPHDGV